MVSPSEEERAFFNIGERRGGYEEKGFPGSGKREASSHG